MTCERELRPLARKPKYITGFCGIGCHEGMRPRGHTGAPLKVCTFWIECVCECHANVTKMFEMTGRERMPLQNPEYEDPKSTYIMPTFEEIAKARLAEESNKVVTLRKPIEVVETQTFDATPTGKRARGQLEDQVLLVCSQFVRGQLEIEVLTPQLVARSIDEVEPPSVGAIGAVFDRWTRIGFARCAKKPVRFESFTAEGLEHGLEYMKDKFKSEAKRIQTTAVSTRLGMR